MTAKPHIIAPSASEAEKGAATSTSPRLLRLPEVMDRVGLRRSAIYKRMSEGRFPRCRSLGPKCSVWVEAEINAWIEEISAGAFDKR